jgi:beta-ribofuranosylaminobenzene 5'-phosphate synthase
MRVTVTAYARLHLGFLNIDDSLGWVHGGVGVGLDAPRLRITAFSAPDFAIEGEHAERAGRYAHRLAGALGLNWRARLRVEESIPEHSGLGSGTQWALAVGTALTRLHGIRLPARDLAGFLSRGRRSGIGVANFESGGFIVEIGHAPAASGTDRLPSEVLLRRDFPSGWRFVLVIPEGAPGLSGQAEQEAFAGAGESRSVAEAVCALTLLRLLPALVEENIAAFGSAMSELDRHTGLFFQKTQGETYRGAGGGIARELLGAGAYGVGQSSWGPCLYALVDDANESAALAAARAGLRAAGVPGRVFVAGARNLGAEVADDG